MTATRKESEFCILEPFQIALFAHRMHSMHNIAISDLSQMIYKSYLLSHYSDFTIVELMNILNSQHILVNCKLNKENLVQLMQKHGVELPIVFSSKENDWQVYEFVGLCFQKYLQSFKIRINDKFKIEHNTFKVVDIKVGEQHKIFDDSVIVLKNMQTSQKTTISLPTFVNMLKKENITYKHSSFFKKIQTNISTSF